MTDYKCKNIIMFYESHDDSKAAKVIKSLLKYAPEGSVVCFEESDDSTKEDFLYNLHKGIESFKRKIQDIKDLSNSYMERQTSSEERDLEIQGQKRHLDESMKEEIFFKNCIHSFRATLRLIEALDEKGLGYCHMDVPFEERQELYESPKMLQYHIRNLHMTYRLLEECEKSEGNVYALVGADHRPIVHHLSEHQGDFDIKEYYVRNPDISKAGILLSCMSEENSWYKDCEEFLDFNDTIAKQPLKDIVGMIKNDLNPHHDEL